MVVEEETGPTVLAERETVPVTVHLCVNYRSNRLLERSQGRKQEWGRKVWTGDTG